MRRIIKAALGSLAGGAFILAGTQVAGSESPMQVYSKSGQLTDLRPDVPNGPLDGASYSIRIIESPDEGTGFRLRLTGINTLVANAEFGAHLHLGRCTARDPLPDTDPVAYTPDTTSGHYNSDGKTASPLNEVWFNFTPDEEGVAGDEPWVQFVPVDDFPPGMSIVIHRAGAALPTSQSPKEACLPIEVATWEKLPE